MRVGPVIFGVCAALIALPVLAQTPDGTLTNVRGKVEKLEGQKLTVKSRDGKMVTVNLADKFGVLGIQKAKLSDIKQGQFIGTAAIAHKDGKLHAQEVLIFPPGVRGSTTTSFWPSLCLSLSATLLPLATGSSSITSALVMVSFLPRRSQG